MGHTDKKYLKKIFEKNISNSRSGCGRGHDRSDDLDWRNFSKASAKRDLRHSQAEQHHSRRLHRKELRWGHSPAQFRHNPIKLDIYKKTKLVLNSMTIHNLKLEHNSRKVKQYYVTDCHFLFFETWSRSGKIMFLWKGYFSFIS
jgi:hypothetical protein